MKNRSRTGRGYWVKANVFPCFEKGKIVGYISIRTKPERARVDRAIEAHGGDRTSEPLLGEQQGGHRHDSPQRHFHGAGLASGHGGIIRPW